MSSKELKLSWKWRIVGLLLCPVALVQSSMLYQRGEISVLEYTMTLDPVNCWNSFRYGYPGGRNE
jgi:hypothetical protein